MAIERTVVGTGSKREINLSFNKMELWLGDLGVGVAVSDGVEAAELFRLVEIASDDSRWLWLRQESEKDAVASVRLSRQDDGTVRAVVGLVKAELGIRVNQELAGVTSVQLMREKGVATIWLKNDTKGEAKIDVAGGLEVRGATGGSVKLGA